MKAERFILSFIAILFGLLVAGVAFYLYQMTRTVSPTSQTTTVTQNPTPTPDTSANFISIDSPVNESVVDKKTISVSGKTVANSTIIVSDGTTDDVVKPTTTGSFSLTQTLDDGTNIIQITVIFPDGTEKKVTRTVTYSTESF